MRSIQLNCPTNVTKMLAEYHMRDKQKGARDRTAGESPALSVEDELKMNEDAGDANDRQRESPSQAGPQRQPQPQPVIRWERFLPVRSLKVLLVENDDSTRHVVSALLRNCSYEVTAVTNGLEAWKFLEDITNHIDLILTEVVTPCLSGIGLLSKIMNHKTFKNVPVIMMSSNDSMGLVFKCFSKGAVDFLVKPIRKNELKNLWQHVWRKCHSSSGSGSESGTWTQKSRKSKSVEGSDNNTGSNNDEDNGSTGLNFRDGSDNGSGTQSSWSKRAVEVDSPQPMSPWDQLADPPDSTCAQVIRLMPEAFSNNWVHKPATKKLVLDNELDNVQMGKDLKIGVPKDPKLQFEDPTKIVSNGISGTNKVRYLESSSNKDADKKEKGTQPLNTETKIGELRNEVTDYVGVISNNTNVKIESVAFDDPSDPSKMAIIKDRSTYDNREIPFIELTLKRQRDTSTGAQERNVLRRSDLSAFTRYNTTSITNQAPTGNVGSCSPLNNSSEAAKTESLHNLQSNSDGNPNQGSNGSSNNDMGSTTDTVYVKSEAYSDKPMLKSPINIHPSSAFQLVQHGHTSSLQHITPDKTNPAIINTVVGHANNMNPPVQVQHHHHHYHHHHHHIHNVQKQKQFPNQDSSSLMNMSAAAPHCGSPDLLGTPVEGNAANYGSASGSNYGSSTAVIAEGIKVMKDNGVAGKSGDGIRSNLNMTAVDQNKFSQREATLNKFRQKRKQRNFEKMVRYQSRKKLAEQRPRVRGQFVRQSAKHKDDTDS